jgi:hypothetical protein
MIGGAESSTTPTSHSRSASLVSTVCSHGVSPPATSEMPHELHDGSESSNRPSVPTSAEIDLDVPVMPSCGERARPTTLAPSGAMPGHGHGANRPRSVIRRRSQSLTAKSRSCVKSKPRKPFES